MPLLFNGTPEAISTGIAPGKTNKSAVLWKDGSNFIFADGGLKIAPEQFLLITKGSAEDIIGIVAVDNEGSAAAVWGDKVSLWKTTTPPTAVDVTRASGAYTGTIGDLWSIVQFGQTVLATNGIDNVQYLVDITSGLFVDLDTVSDLPDTFRCDSLNKLGPYIIAFHTDQDNTEARWCTEDDPTTWIPLATNSARDINLRDINSDIVASSEFGDALMVWGRNRAHIFQFLGPPFFFGAKKILDGTGLAGKNAFTTVGRLIYGMSNNTIFVTDGSTYQNIDDPDIHQYVFEEMLDIAEIKRTTVWYDPNEDEVYFSFMTLDGKGKTVSFNPKLQVWSLHSYFRSAADSGGLFDNPLLGDNVGNVWAQGGLLGSPSSFIDNPLHFTEAFTIINGYSQDQYSFNGYSGIFQQDAVAPLSSPFAIVRLTLNIAGGGIIDLGSSIETSNAFIETKAISLQADELVYFIDKIVTHIRDGNIQTNLKLEIHGSDEEYGTFDLLDVVDIIGNDPVYVDPPGMRYYKFIWRDTGIVSRFVIDSFEVYGEPGGEEF